MLVQGAAQDGHVSEELAGGGAPAALGFFFKNVWVLCFVLGLGEVIEFPRWGIVLGSRERAWDSGRRGSPTSGSWSE